MKNINLFGLKVMFEVKRNRNSDENIYSSEYSLREKIIYLIAIMFVMALSSKFFLLSSNNNYKVGDIVKSDIYAPSTIIFKDNSAKEKIIENMIQKSGKEYIYSSDAEKIYLEYFDEFFDSILNIKNHTSEIVDYTSIERNTNKKISPMMVQELLSLKSSEVKRIKNITRQFLEKAYNAGIVQEKNTVYYKEPYNEKFMKLTPLQQSIVDTFTSPNYIYDEAKTKKNIKEKVSQIKDQYLEIKAGTLIAKTGEVINERRMKILEACGVYSYNKSIGIFIANFLYLGIISALFYTIFF